MASTPNQRKAKKALIVLILLAITLFGGMLRLHNLSPYKFYPDSYQSLVVAHNIQTYHSPVGTLGPDGLVYPDFISWTRPLYPLVIVMAAVVTHASFATVAQYSNLVASCLAIPVAAYVGYRVTGRRAGAGAGAILLALSYEHSVWSGFILTESLATLLSLSLLAVLIRYEQSKQVQTSRTTQYLVPTVIGVVLALAVLTRYEYVVLALPVVWWLVGTSRLLSAKMLPLLLALAGFSAVVGAVMAYAPLPPWAYSQLAEQIGSHTWQYVIGLGFIIVMICLLRIGIIGKYIRAGQASATKYLSPRSARTIGLACGLLTIVLLAMLPAVRSFMLHEPLLLVTAAYGLYTTRAASVRRHYGLAALCIAVLLPLYMITNPDMERYTTHLVPFVLLPATLGLVKLWDIIRCSHSINRAHPQQLLILGLITLLALQATLTYQGLRRNYGPLWFTTGYEERAAQQLAPIASPGDVLLVAMPEAYFAITGHSTNSLALDPPYAAHLASYTADAQFLVVDDMAMRSLFPVAATAIQANFEPQKVVSFYLHTPYRYGTSVQAEDSPVRVYRVSQPDLLRALANQP